MTGKELAILEQVGIVGICIYVIHILTKVVLHQMGKKKAPQEQESKNLSRDRIAENNIKIREIHQTVAPFYDMRNQIDEIHGIVSAKDKGTPLIYNPNLDIAIAELNTSTKQTNEYLKEIVLNGRKG